MTVKKKRKLLFRLLLSLICLIFALSAAFYIGYSRIAKELDVQRLTAPPQSTVVLDAAGGVQAVLSGGKKRTCVPLSDVPQDVKNAFLAAEDVRFYSHKGIDLKRIGGALLHDIAAGAPEEGASTLTQQLIKLSHLSGEKTVSRKIREAFLALALESRCTKDEILEAYLNFVYFGGGAYGIEAAAQRYFGVSAKDLTLPQGAVLAGIVKSPSGYAPHLDPEKSKRRRDLILSQMDRYGMITEKQCRQAKAEPLTLCKSPAASNAGGSFYTDEVIRRACELLSVDAEELYRAGLTIQTNEDPALQQKAEEIFANAALFPESAADGTKAEGALTVLRVSDGTVAAIVGGREHEGWLCLDRAVRLRRSPGSSLKPILVYAPAIEWYGYMPTTLLRDTEEEYFRFFPNGKPGKLYGTVTMRSALSRSLNVPALTVLEAIGPDAAVSFGKQAGLPLSGRDASLSLALGGISEGITVTEAACAYSFLAGGGEGFTKPETISRITDREGSVLWEYIPQKKRLLSKETAFYLCDMLRTAVSDGTAKALSSLPFPIAAKTGTVRYGESDTSDAWCVAFDPQYIAAVWVGFDRTDETHHLSADASGGSTAAPLLAPLFSALYQDPGQASGFSPPETLQKAVIDEEALLASGRCVTASVNCPAPLTEYFPENAPPEKAEVPVPLPPENVSAQPLSDGRCLIRLTAAQDDVCYFVTRITENGNEPISRLSGKKGERLSFIDETADRALSYSVSPQLSGRIGAALPIAIIE